MNIFNLPLESIEDLINKLLPFLDYVWTFMAIHIYTFLGLLALVPKFLSEPILCGRLCDRSIDFKRREDGCIYVLTECPGGNSAKSLGCKICAHVVQE